MTLKEKLSPAAESFSAEEISQELDIPIEMIHKMKKVGVITPTQTSNDNYSYQTVKFIEGYWSANAAKMLSVKP
ncbi:MAG: hypothetical protein A2268_03045 [Candidatus Raymondbacteria bacterium RifOxyA12_full_50_37]|uniref:HTH merR-type domain-containing protein n=1 Tax=Candidatus Raymondbacteria bacterium RIFOXYD12_FULL_49_13 TaxID=1817890 RepID=A0A1F7F8Z0_UNCRA|nr:MAG: hypothetical protein A2248_17150 [Candidatus Raymondbacteria bacterium RIFOXYA2_FULL_49_16]OGJ90754.1 MAG: hypothetical protein A2268_03045 [Candidatus Raymondbacteria bacterium RifOxyA12_full_50_37]OGJ92946.1 MAG: hypothetical protein A2350_04910 [Candidatus Raymondbacteria bacterium RifOxyB12_full_50_8]OGJ98391.1 MAG: hypothetical protein A2453_09055 [Candidatus Raymondbacteria bacterium RIFOXYC2_FULL_50_21]OGK03115.1 MAG: hypothetical protein A2519_06890 [Candidatus Raymondbacteria b